MISAIAELDLWNRRWSLLAYCAGMGLYALVVVALYPAFEHSSSLDTMIRSDRTAAALFGVTGSLSSSAGWLNGNIYTNFYPLVMLLIAIGYGAAAIAGQDEDGTLCLIATLPASRRRLALGKVGALAAQATALAAIVAACVIAGRWFDLTTSPARVLATSAAVLVLGIDFGLIAMALGALTGRRGPALGLAAAFAAASYLISSLAPVVSWIAPARYASLFYWSVGDNQLAGGVSPADWAVLIGVGALAAYLALRAFARLDLH